MKRSTIPVQRPMSQCTRDNELDLDSIKPLPSTFFDGDDVDEIARKLIGTVLIFNEGDSGDVGGIIAETEAYDESDPTAHCYRPTIKGGDTMRKPGGHAYIFAASYGYCLNFVTGKKDIGSAVLIRALIPKQGKKVMRIRRGPYDRRTIEDSTLMCPGPVALCEALGITNRHNELGLFAEPFHLYERQGEPELLSGPRVGVEQTIARKRPSLRDEDFAREAIRRHRRWVDAAAVHFTRKEHRSTLNVCAD